MHNAPPALRIARGVSPRRGAVVAVTALACTALMGACGSSKSSTKSSPATTNNVNTAQVALSIEETVLAKRHSHVKVVCPATVPAIPGRTFECIATGRATKPPFTVTKTPFVVTVQSARGYVTYEGK
jgi:hypothetical protein